jgi:hypothetical protein
VKNRFQAFAFSNSQLVPLQRGAQAASLAATLLRGAFAAAPPVAFVRHVADECGTGRGGGGGGGGAGGRHSRHRFTFERAWEGMRLGDGGVVGAVQVVNPVDL